MELMDVLKKDGQWAYLPTVIYLSFNIIATVSTLVLGFSDSGVQFVHTTFNSFLGVGFIYFFYIIAKFSKSIINSKKAKRLDLDYERCQDFGDIVSNTSTLVNYIVWLIYVQFLLTAEARPLGIDIGLFSLIIGVNTILSIIFIFKCVNGMTKKKAMHKEDKQEI